ncbi:peptidase [Hellea sp.]|nr:peptidase [Hellea sp.]
MTYCVGLLLNKGLVFMSDTRTNAGVDDIATVKKTRSWEVKGDRVITVMTAGNLATTQAVISLLDERSSNPEKGAISILTAPTMFQIARLVGDTLEEVIQANTNSGQTPRSTFNATMILGGQVAGLPPQLFLIYPEGNFIAAQDDSPFFQIGETKYGKPILVREKEPEMSFGDAVRLLLVSFDSTIKANLSVGLPLDLTTYETDSLQLGKQKRFTRDDKYLQDVCPNWGRALKKALSDLPTYKFDDC